MIGCLAALGGGCLVGLVLAGAILIVAHELCDGRTELHW